MLIYDLILAGQHGRPVDLDVLHLEAEFGGALKVVVDVGVVQENLGGNAADVKAGASQERVLFHHGGLQPPLAGANGGHIPAGSAADDYEIVFGHTDSPRRPLVAPIPAGAKGSRMRR